MTVSTKEAASDLSSVLSCRYGDTVTFKVTGVDRLVLDEIAITHKKGKTFP